MRVCHFVTNPYTFDTRVKKQCESLTTLGCAVTVIGTQRMGLPTRERLNGVMVVRVKPNLATWGAPFRVLGLALRERTGRSRIWTTLDSIYRAGEVAARQVGDFGRSVAKRLHRFARPGDADPDTAVLAARETESSFPLRSHVRFWAATILAVILLPLFPLVIVVMAVFGLVGWLFLRVVPRRGRQLWRRGTRPARQWFYRTARMLTMMEAGYAADANVYQANDYDTLAATSLCARARGVDYVYDIHELYDESFPTRKQFRTRYWIRLWEGTLGRRAIRTCTVGDDIARIMVERYRFDRPDVIYNAQVYIENPRPDRYIREQIGDTHDERTVFVYAGRITRGRGLLECTRAFSELPRRAALVIMGNADDEFLAELRETVAAGHLEDRVYLLDPVPSDDLPAVLQCADVGLMLTTPACLSYYYGLGNKMFHYVNAGIPVLASLHPEKQRFIDTHGTGVCVDPVAPGPIATAIRRMLDHPAEVEFMKARCREIAPMISWQHEERKYLNLYTDVYEHILFGARGAA